MIYFAGVRFAKTDSSPVNLLTAIMIIVVTLVVGEAVRILNELIFVSYIRLAKQGSYLALMLVISIFPYFITKRKQLLVDLLVGIVALKDTEYCAVKEKLASYDVQAEENKD